MRETTDLVDADHARCPYVRCGGTVTVEVTGTWGDGRVARYGTCQACQRPVELVEGVDQPTLEGIDP